MRKYFLFTALLVLAFVISIAGLRTGVVQAKSWGFTNADFCGTFGSQWTGSVYFPTAPFNQLNGPYAMLGRVAADGLGKMSAKFIECYNGTILRSEATGTYSVKPDGTLIMLFSYVLPGVGSFTLEVTGILFDEGRQARVTCSKIIDPPVPAGFTGMAATSTLIKQGKSWGWSDADWNGSFANRSSGVIALPAQHPLALLNGPFAMVGRVTSDGRGGFAGNTLISFNGSMSQQLVTGAYTVSPDGTLKTTVKAPQLTLIYDGILVDGGNQLYLLLTELPGVGLPAGYTGVTWTEIHSRQ